MAWEVIFHPTFRAEYAELSFSVQGAVNDRIDRLREQGPSLGHPHADTLRDSRHANMKELPFRTNGELWRVAFAFDPRRQAVLLLAGNKRGGDERLFYQRLIGEADARFDDHLARLRG